MRILFVCTGNTCRSPMAEAIFRKHGADLQNVEVGSRGISVTGARINPMAVNILRKNEYETSFLESRQLMEADVPGTLIITMEESHRDFIRTFMDGERVATLKEIAYGISDDMDIADPFGGSEADYARAFREIEEAVREFIRGMDS